MEVFCILMEEAVREVYVFVKMHVTVYLNLVHLEVIYNASKPMKQLIE